MSKVPAELKVPLTEPRGIPNNPILDAALGYASRGIVVFPLNGKLPLTKNGFKDASCDEGTIVAWWKTFPHANVGVPTGRINALFVIDVDGLEGEVSLAALIETHGSLPPTFEVQTGRVDGGRHIYLKQPPGLTIRTSQSALGPHVDVKADGGYVVAHQSIHPETNRPYIIKEDREPADAPAWLLGLVRNEPDPKESEAVKSKRIGYGRRNTWLFKRAASYRRHGDDEETIHKKLKLDYQYQCEHEPPINDVELRKIAASSGKYRPATTGDSTVGALFTDAANVDRYIAQNGDDLKYCADLKEWRAWNAKVWVRDDITGAPLDRALATARSIYYESAEQPDDDVRKKSASWAIASNNRSHLEAMPAIARSSPIIRVPDFHKVFDKHPYLLACENGIVELPTGKLHDHDRSLMLTQFSPVMFNPKAQCPEWDNFLINAFAKDQEMIDYIDRVMGYWLTGLTRERAFFLLLGKGRNGKSTLAELMKRILGDGAHKADFATFTQSSFQRSGSDASPDIAIMHDKRLVWAVERDEKRHRLNTALLKEHSGEDSITARGLRKGLITFRPQYKVCLIANDVEIVGDTALWDRLHHIIFNYRIPEDKVVRDFLGTVLVSELEGIFARVIRGAANYFEYGLRPPLQVIQAKEDLKSDSEAIFDEWFNARVIKTVAGTLTLAHAKEDLEKWAWSERHLRKDEIPGRRALSDWLMNKAQGFKERSSGSRNVFIGLVVKPVIVPGRVR